ncbi:hypothetical protein DGWBC_1173 [Dehalogenimonas sp. WBC-2]|nr:hypothetical protein DGWBC_1173 [Dehalogenimonas sp. WBC-2]
MVIEEADINSERKYHLAGWILFLFCAGFFIASAAKNGDGFSLTGGIIFFIACIIFMIPLINNKE